MLEPESLAWWKRLVFDYSDVTSVLCDEIKRLRAINTEMVAACEGLLDYVALLVHERVEIGLPQDHPDFVPEPIINARLAIARAKGEQVE